MSSAYQDHEGTYSRGVVGTTTAPEDPQDEKRRLEAAAMRRGQEARLLTARHRVHDVAYELARDGLSAETIRAAMLDMATTGADIAALYIARYDAAEAADREDDDDRRELRDERETAYEEGTS